MNEHARIARDAGRRPLGDRPRSAVWIRSLTLTSSLVVTIKVVGRGDRARRYDAVVQDISTARHDHVDLERIVALREFDAFARLATEPGAFDHVAGGAWDELSLADNEAAWRRLRVRPRVLVDVSRIDTSTTITRRHVERASSLPSGA
jgi:hypothetical protein